MPETPQCREDSLFVEQADAPLIPGQDRLTEPDGRIDQRRGNAAATGCAARDGRPRPHRPRRPRSRPGLGRAARPAGSTPRCFPLPASRVARHRVEPGLAGSPIPRGPGWSGGESRCTGRGVVTSATAWVRKASHSAPSRKIKTLTASPSCARAPSSPLLVFSPRASRAAEPASHRDHSARYPSGAGRSKKVRAAAAKTGQLRQWMNVFSSGQLRSPVTPIWFQQSPSPGCRPRRSFSATGTG